MINSKILIPILQIHSAFYELGDIENVDDVERFVLEVAIKDDPYIELANLIFEDLVLEKSDPLRAKAKELLWKLLSKADISSEYTKSLYDKFPFLEKYVNSSIAISL